MDRANCLSVGGSKVLKEIYNFDFEIGDWQQKNPAGAGFWYEDDGRDSDTQTPGGDARTAWSILRHCSTRKCFALPVEPSGQDLSLGSSDSDAGLTCWLVRLRAFARSWLPDLCPVRLTASSLTSSQKRNFAAIAYKLFVLRRFATSPSTGSIASIDVSDPDAPTSQ